MFAKSIVLSDAFLDMPLSARCLYFTLGMLADDDGFIGSPKAIMRQCGASQDDMIILLQKRFILSFESGVIVIKHWRLNNYLQGDRHKTTTYVEEKAELALDEKGAYTEKKDDNYREIEVEEKSFIEVPSKPLSDARQARAKAKKESSLPTTFDARIRNAFVGKRCPICNVIMTYEFNTTKPTIQHNLPISKGGKHELDNISVICQSCNTSIQNKVETPPYNTEEVKAIWECIGNVYTDKDSIGKDSIDKSSIMSGNEAENGNSDVKTIIEYLNLKAKKSFRATTKLYERHINARLSEGYTLEDFKHVIDVKCAEWMNTDHEQYLRPDTLFAPSHFDSYLNQKIVKAKPKSAIYFSNDECREQMKNETPTF